MNKPGIMRCGRILWRLSLLVAVVLGMGKAATAEPSDKLAFQVNYIYRSAGQDGFEPLDDGDMLHSGDHYRIIFIPGQECHVYIYQVDSAGHAFQLFPVVGLDTERVIASNPVRAGKIYILPAPYKAYLLDDQTGTEKIYFLAFRTPPDRPEQYFAKLRQSDSATAGAVKKSSPKESPPPDALRPGTPAEKLDLYYKPRGLHIVEDIQHGNTPIPPVQNPFQIVERRLDQAGCDHVQVLTFRHE
jgi:hypothetical protein